MPDIAPPSDPVVELTDSDRADQAILIITASSATAKAPTSAGLMLHFDRARVVPIGGVREIDSLAVELKADSYDTVVIDGPALGPYVRNAVASRAAESLRSGGRLVVVMDPEPHWSPAPAAAADVPPDMPPDMPEVPDVPVDVLDGSPRAAPAASLAGLTWEGVATLHGTPCALLGRRAEDAADAYGADDHVGVRLHDQHATPADVAARLSTMEQTLAAKHAYDSATAGGRRGGPRRERYDSEAALLAHLRTAVQEQAAERQRREQAEQRREDLEKRYTSLERQHARLRASKVGVMMARYWQVRKRLRRALGG